MQATSLQFMVKGAAPTISQQFDNSTICDYPAAADIASVNAKLKEFQYISCVQATSLHIMVEGVAVLTASRNDGSIASSPLYSGCIFNLAVCNAFGVYIGLERAPIE